MAHSQQQNFNRSHFSKADGATLKQNYEDFFAEPDAQAVEVETIEESKEQVVEENQKNNGDFVSFDDVWF